MNPEAGHPPSASTGPPLTTGQVAAEFGVHRVTVYEWAAKGLVPCFRTPGGHYRFNRADVEKLLEPEPTEASA